MHIKYEILLLLSNIDIILHISSMPVWVSGVCKYFDEELGAISCFRSFKSPLIILKPIHSASTSE